MTPQVMAFIAMIGVLGYLCDRAAARAHAALTPWAPSRRDVRDEPSRRMRAAARLRCLPLLLIAIWQAWATLAAADPAHADCRRSVLAAADRLIASGDLPVGDPAEPRPRVRRLRGRRAASPSRSASRWARSRAVERNLDPLVESFRPIAAIAILPLAILWLGTGTRGGGDDRRLRGVLPDRHQHDRRREARRPDAAAGRARRWALRRLTTLRTVVVPGALPSIGVGLRIALGVAWTAIVAAELAVGAKAGGGGSGGIGQMMFVFYAYSIELNRIVVCMIAVGLVALAARPAAARACCAGDAVERAMNGAAKLVELDASVAQARSRCRKRRRTAAARRGFLARRARRASSW